jgi:hypothetical protein
MIPNDPGQLSILSKLQPSVPVVLFIGDFNYVATAYDADIYVRNLDHKPFYQTYYDWCSLGGVSELLPLSILISKHEIDSGLSSKYIRKKDRS